MDQGKRATTITWINTTSFALSFAAWVALGPSVRTISAELGIDATAATFLKAVPILIGATCRIPVGILADRFGARRMFPTMMILASLGALTVSFAGSFAGLVAGGLILGLVGTTFVVGVQSVSSWTEAKKQGTALGIFGAGNVGSALTTFGMPILLGAIGWRWSFRLYAGVLVMTAAGYALLVRNQARKGPAPTFKGLLAPITNPQALRFGLYYMATFGVFVATTLGISDVYIDIYHVSPKSAGLLATTFTFSASLIRIVGGRLSDKFGGRKVTRTALVVIAAGLAGVVFAPSLAVTVGCVFIAGLAMGVGSASTFKYIAEYFPKTMGAVGGVVGGIGGVGGFVMPLVANWVKTKTGSALYGILPLLGVAVLALVVQAVAIALRAGAVPAKITSIAPPPRPSVRPSSAA